MDTTTILIVDDDESIVRALQILLVSEGFKFVASRSPSEALDILCETPCHLALVDLNYVSDTTSGQEGLNLITALCKQAEDLPVVAMTGWGTIEIAVEAMRHGAVDFIEKPWDNNRLLTTIRTHLELRATHGRERRLRAENALLRSEAESKIVSRSESMAQLLSVARKVAQSAIPVLITGENGTGKSLLASYIHEQSGHAGSFISVNMGAISETTFESELFGHTRGAFTDAKNERVGRVELADKGTLFLDEIANLPLTQQAKMLRLLEERCYEKLGSSYTKQADIRFISATNADLEALIAERSFRQDLLYRLNGVTLHVPALRERRADIMPLAENILRRAKANYRNAAAVEFSAGAREALEHYVWPGNIRELQHVVERAVLLAPRQEISERDLQLTPRAARGHGGGAGAEEIDRLTLDDAEKWFVRRALELHDGNANAAAQALGISRSSLYRRLGKQEPG